MHVRAYGDAWQDRSTGFVGCALGNGLLSEVATDAEGVEVFPMGSCWDGALLAYLHALLSPWGSTIGKLGWIEVWAFWPRLAVSGLVH